MHPEKLSLDRKLFLQKETVAVMNPVEVVQSPQAISAPYNTALSMDSPARCFPCCDAPPITFVTCRN
ncbi:hypothetical protein HGH92_19660 [Chitinophaga varians]|uniref:Uncharacterized protein n=1 Tax=Chitinophaga varians TaxID=2202339 RepID=A0A847RUH0_9BACT|nr:hypothetical protein [Chitinophaga varians]NLR66536.1 hypothetical protein [Chitinophaga varians]